MASIISTTKLSKVFSSRKSGTRGQDVVALRDVTLEINQNQFVGLLGKNGAGKSTLVKIICGILKCSNGNVQVFGRDPFLNRIKNNQEIGVIFGQRSQLKWDLSPLETFNLLKIVYQIDDKGYRNRLDEFVTMLEMGGYVNRPVRTLSLGQRMKCEFVASLIHSPKLLLLDEPTIGLDILSKSSIIDFLNNLKKEGNTTVILTTHDLSDISNICERIIFIAEGEIVLDKNIDQILTNANKRKDMVITLDTQNATIIKEHFSEEVLSKMVYRPYTIVIKNISATMIPGILNEILTTNQVSDVSIEGVEFEEIIKQYYISKFHL